MTDKNDFIITNIHPLIFHSTNVYYRKLANIN